MATTELNPSVDQASSTAGQMSALGSSSFGGGWWGGSPSTVDASSTDLSSLSGSDMFGTGFNSGSTSGTTPNYSVGGGDLSSLQSATGIDTSGLGSLDPSLISGLGSAAGALAGTDATGATGTSGQPSWLQQLTSGVSNAVGGWSGLGSTLAGAAPYAGIAAIGLNQAKQTQQQNQAYASQLAALGGPDTAAGQQLLKQFQSGQIRPDQQAVTNLATQQGQTLIDSGAGLSAIAQQAYKDYQSGKLQPAQEQQLADQVAAQKQQLRQTLGPNVDSSVLAQQDAQIDNQAMITRQNLLDQRFATGNTAYDQWLKSTTAGQQLQLEGQQFGSKSLDDMLTQSLNLSNAGMQPVEQSIQLAMQSDTQLSQEVSSLIGNLASAYAYSKSGGKPGTTVNIGSGAAGQGAGGTAGRGTGVTAGQGIGSAAGSVAGLAKGFMGQGSQSSTGLTQFADQQAQDALASGNYQLGQDFQNQFGSQVSDQQLASNLGVDPSILGLDGTDTSGLDASMTDSGLADLSSPSGAGGQAAASNFQSVDNSGMMGSIMGGASGALGVASGIEKGGVTGDISAGLSAASLANKAGLLPSGVGGDIGAASAGLGLVTGLEKGGVAGDVQAATSAAQLANQAGLLSSGASTALGTAIPIIGAAMFAYGTVSSQLASETTEAQLAYDYSSNPEVISAVYRDYKAGEPVSKAALDQMAAQGLNPVFSGEADYRDTLVR